MSIIRLAASDLLPRLAQFSCIIDARSEDEYALDCLPSAVNWPTLRNDERRIVGTAFKQISAFDARKLGAAMAARNIACHLDREGAALPKHWAPLLYCWRGGQRSGALALILDQVGFRVTLIDGGYKAFRRAVIDHLPTLAAQLSFRAICGTTGSGKTRLLHALARHGAQVLDLEALASHRASVLGALPGEVQPGQKRFETLLWEKLSALDPAHPVYVECESKKVGDLAIPEELMTAIRAAPCLHLQLPDDERVQLLLEDYRSLLDNPTYLSERLDLLRSVRGHATVEAWQTQVRSGAFGALVRELLQQHYDPGYLRSLARSFAQFSDAPIWQAPDRSDEAMGQLAQRILASAAR